MKTRFLVWVTSMFFILLNSFVVSSQPLSEYTITHYNINNFLKDNYIEQILEDGNGFIWFKSAASIIRFDGNEFKEYRHKTDDPMLQIGADIPGRLIKDNYGHTWINNLDHAAGAKNISEGLLKYDLSKDGFIKYKPTINSFIRSLSIEKIDTLVWLGSRTDGLYLYNLVTNEIKHFANSQNEEQFNLNNHIRSIKQAGDFLILGTNSGIWKFNKEKRIYSRDGVPEIFQYGRVSSKTNHWVCRWENDNTIIYKTDQSLNITDEIKFPASTFFASDEADTQFIFGLDIDSTILVDTEKYKQNPNERYQLNDPGEVILDALFDRAGNIWIASDAGVRKFTPPELNYKIIDAGKNYSFGNFSILNISNQTYGLFMGLNNYLAISKLPMTRSSITHFDFPGKHDSWSNLNYPFQGKNNIWIASWGRGLLKIPIDYQKNYLSARGTSFLQLDDKNPYSISSPFTWVVAEDGQENVWVGHYDRGIDIINTKKEYGKEGSIIKLRYDSKDPESLSSDLIQGLVPFENDEMLIGTGLGLDVYRKGKINRIADLGTRLFLNRVSNGEIFGYTFYKIFKVQKDDNKIELHELPIGNMGRIFDIESDSQGRLWISTSAGIIVYDPALQITNSVRFSSEASSDGIIRRINDQEFYYFNTNSIVSFNPELYQWHSNSIPVFLSSLRINNNLVDRNTPDITSFLQENIATAKTLTLDYLHNNFELEFSAIDFKSPSRNLYQYQLLGYNPGWIQTDARNRKAAYTNLPPGNYTFRVKASNHQGIWSDYEKSLQIIILPPPWRTWWAYTGYLMLAAGALVMARRNIVQRERLKSNLKLEHLELEKAKEVDRVKTSFFTNISHEFRTPLTLIKGPVQDLMEEYTNHPKTKERLKLIQRNSDLLLKLINQLLDLAKLESGSLKIEKSESDLTAFISAVSGSFSSMAQNKNVELKLDLPPEHFNVFFDKDKLETILINLISNAIKFTPEGGSVTVKARVEKSNLLLSVKDTGIGIPEDQQQAIFERFHQVSEAHQEVGTGIGLALVKELVALMGGTIEVKSKVGEGSMFGIMLPIEIGETIAGYQLPVTGEEVLSSDSEQPETSDQKPATELSLKEDGATVKPQILIVEDNTDLRAFIINSLGNEFHFLEAADGKQGLDKAIENVPDLIVSDVMMPGMDGITMAGKLKSDVRTSHIPIIILTAKSTEESKLSGLQKGADDYLTKPFNKQELLLKVRNGVMSRMKLREKIRLELMKEAPKIEVASADEQFLMKVKEVIHQRLSDEQLSVESVAEEIGLSRAQLYRKVTALTGVSVNELIRSFRLKKAAQLLEQNWGPVSQVAYEVGFSNLSYFSKVFKEEFGVLPSEYSNQEL